MQSIISAKPKSSVYICLLAPEELNQSSLSSPYYKPQINLPAITLTYPLHKEMSISSNWLPLDWPQAQEAKCVFKASQLETKYWLALTAFDD